MFQDITQGSGDLTASVYTWEILIMLLVAFLLGLLLGYILWYRWRKLYLELQTEHDRLKALHLDLEKDHASLKYKAEELEKENAGLHTKVRGLEGDVSGLKFKLNKCESDLAAATAAGVSGKGAVLGAVAAPPPKPDDLKKIEGIGPKIEKLCNDIGIWTWAQLAATPVEKLQKMLDDAGPNYRISEPGTWPKQAKLAAEGKWGELKEYQDFLAGGKDPGQ
jgi:predicted flap endonuclease-1-like 5' DNA nuclease